MRRGPDRALGWRTPGTSLYASLGSYSLGLETVTNLQLRKQDRLLEVNCSW